MPPDDVSGKQVSERSQHSAGSEIQQAEMTMSYSDGAFMGNLVVHCSEREH